MANTRELVIRRKSVRNTRKITKTMEMVSTAKLARAQNNAVAARPYSDKLRQVIGDLAAASEDIRHPLLEAHSPIKKAVVIVLTADRGLCGAFNVNILKEATLLLNDLKNRDVEVEIIVQGKKGRGAFKYQKIPVAQEFLGVSDKPEYARAESIATDLIQRFGKKEIDEAYVVYSTFKSMVNQIPRADKVLPLSGLGTDKSKDGDNDSAAKTEEVGFLFHPNPEKILTEVLPLVVRMSIFTAMLDNCAGEHAARRLAMKNATDAADDMIKALSREYNRARQSKITQEIAEIVSGSEAQ